MSGAATAPSRRRRVWKWLGIVTGTLVLAAGVGALLLLRDFPHENEIAFVRGNVITMDEGHPTAAAVLVRDGRIVAVGTDAQIDAAAGSDAAVVDLAGKTLMPGFIDAHSHVDITAFLHDMVDLSGFTHPTAAEVWAELSAAVKRYPPGDWIPARGLDPILTADLQTPTIEQLDQIAPDNPLVILSQTLHSYWANTRAFEAAGISRTTPDPSGASYYGRDAEGNLNGYIAEQVAFEPIKAAYLAQVPNQALLAAFDATLRDYAANGNTTVVTAGPSSDQKILMRLQQHLSGGRPTLVGQALAAIGMFPDRSPLPRHFVYVRADTPELLPPSPENGDDFFAVKGVKFWQDGSPYTGSMQLSDPYLNNQFTSENLHIGLGHTGEALLDSAELTAAITEYNRRGWQVMVHSQGDEASREVMRAFTDAAKAVDPHPLRNRMEHNFLIDSNLFGTMKQLDMTPSFHVNHIYYYGGALRDNIVGSDRANAALPLAAAEEAGLEFSLHADQPMFPSEPFSLVATAVERRTKEGDLLGPDQAITTLEALKAVTTMAAWQLHMEDQIGAVTVGRYGDLVVLDRDPTTTPAAELRTIKVLRTFVAGNEVPR